MTKFSSLGIILLSALIILNSCRKGSNVDNNDVIEVINNNTCEIVSNDLFKMFLYNTIAAEDSIYHPNDTLNFHFIEPCLQISISPYDTSTWPKTITLAFPESGCYCSDGNIRGGQIIITANGLLKSVGSMFNINLNNYSVNGISVNGTKKITVTKIALDKPVSLNDSCILQVSSVSGNGIWWHSQHSLQWVLGGATESNLSDDLFIYNGTCSTESFTGIITDALQFVNNCFWIGSGKIEISPTGLSKRQVAYLDSCLNQANVIINNETYRVNF
jgi:hypothetical protein